MLEVTYCLSGTNIHDLHLYGDHIRRIVDLVLASQVIAQFAAILQMTDDNVDILSMKINVLKCLCLLSIGIKLFNGQEIQLRL